MQIGVIGLGRMGGNITRRFMENGHQAVVYDHDPNAVVALSRDGAIGAKGLDTLVDQLRAPRAIWLMLPAGKITEDTIVQLARLLAPDDILIDGGNTFWKDDIRRAKMLKGRAIHYVDVGTSGGDRGVTGQASPTLTNKIRHFLHFSNVAVPQKSAMGNTWGTARFLAEISENSSLWVPQP